METWGIVLAAGRGSRFGGAKQFAEVRGRRLVDHVVDLMLGLCDGVVLVLPRSVAWGGPPVEAVVEGGATRADSVRAGLAALPPEADVVIVHDPAHPLAHADLFTNVVAAVRAGADAAAPAIPVDDPLKVLDDHNAVARTISRDQVVLMQTPHAFRVDALRAAHVNAPEAPEDTELIERAGGHIVMVAGDLSNLHVTAPQHLDLVARLAGPGWPATPAARARPG